MMAASASIRASTAASTSSAQRSERLAPPRPKRDRGQASKIMLKRRHARVSALAGVFAAALAGDGQAQQSTTASYDDWTVRCVMQPGPPPKRICHMEQLARLPDKAEPISRVAIAPPANARPLQLVVQLPVNVWLPTGLKLHIGANDVAPRSGAFSRCLPAGCFAAIELGESGLKQLRSATTPGRVT
jgi:invasion protein IalB